MAKIETHQKSFFTPTILTVLLAGFIIRIILSPFGALTLDQNTFVAWSLRLVGVGFGKFYFGSWSDYLPGYLYVLYLLGLINKLNIIPVTILYKLPGILSDIGTGYLIYRIVSKILPAQAGKNKNWGIISSSLYLFNPAVIANSAVWGQVDSLTALFSILSLWCLDFNPYLSAASLAVGTLIKPQMAIISLIILILMILRKWNLKRIVIYVLSSFFVFVAGFIPFSGGENLASFIVSRITISLNQYPYTSINAFNFWQIIGGWKPDAGLNIIGGLIALALFFIFGIKFLKQKASGPKGLRPGGEYSLLAFTYACSFLFMTRMHERHLLPVFAPLSIAVVMNPILIYAFIGFSFIYVANLYWAWNWVTNNFQDVFGDGLIKLLSLANVLMLSFFAVPEKIGNLHKVSLFGNLSDWLTHSDEARKGEIQKVNTFNKIKLSSKAIKTIFLGVVIFASITRFYNLGSPTNHYFDEVYHAFTAQNMLHGITKAWEWWNPNPNGFAYEWTHPPLAKELMAVSMKFLGENSFGWRFPGALLGVGSVIVIFFIAKEIFDDEMIALLSSAVLSLEGLPLVLSRIGMNDSYMLFFALASLLSYFKKKNLLASIFLGLSLASKWSALWVIPIIFVAHFIFKRKLNWTYAFFFIIPIFLYISTYFPLFTNREIQTEYVANTGYATRTDSKTGIIPLDMFMDTQKQMWWYHTRLKATHPYSSMWYTWPFLIRPIYLYTSDEINGEVARIYAMGNPAIFWIGTISVIAIFYYAVHEKDKKLGFVIFSYLIFFTPWAISPRIMFLYHYLPSIPFMAIAVAYMLRRYAKLVIPFFLLSVILFIYFYPHFAGLKIPLNLDTSYYWLTSWR